MKTSGPVIYFVKILLISTLCDKSSCSEENSTVTTEQAETKNSTFPVKCGTPGELVPNYENCRKYYKCSNGEPSLQSCPGTLIFDSVLKICNWPETTTCISDLLLVKPRRDRPKSPGFGRGSQTNTTQYQFSQDVVNALRHVATEAPVIVNVTPANKLSKRILSLFSAKARKRHRNNILSSKVSDNRSRSDITQGAFNKHEQVTFRNIHERLTTTRRTTTTTRTTPTTTTRRTTSHSPRFNIKPRIRQNPLLRRRPFTPPPVQSTTSRSQTVTSSAKHDDDDDDESVAVNVRSESSVSSVSSYVRVSITDLDDQRPFSNGRGGEQFLSETHDDDDYLTRLRQELELSEPSSSAAPAKSAAKPIKCHTGASNELYAHPRNCRKYYKCQNGEPSLQSCPANLIFDTNLKICNWPTASECVEDPDAPLPQHVTSDREPPQDFNAINIDDLGDSPAEARPVDFSSASVPSVWEARQREELLKSEYPQFAKVKETVRTLDTKLVEKVRPGDPSNPDNVKRVEFILSEENYEDLFPRHHPSYTYRRLLQAIAKFPAICSYVGREETSDAVCRKTLATMFAHFTQETGAHNPSDKEYDEWRQGLNVVREQGCTDTSPGCGYNDNCEDTDSITKKWACGKDVSGKWRKYYGRGAKQLSYNFNYGQFSQAMFDDRRLLLDHPDFVADTWLNLASSTWFYVTPQPPKPSMLHVIDGTWVPNQQDKLNGIMPGFGATINIINGGVECNTRDGRESRQASNRIAYYKQFAWYLYVDYENEELGCAKQKQFSAGGAGALPIYWDKDWSYPYSCKLVNYQTAHSALVDGEYIDCVEENFQVKIR